MDRMTDKRSKAESRKQRVFEKLVNHMRRKGEWVPNDYPCDE